MKLTKKLILGLFFIGLPLFFTPAVKAQEPITAYLFHGDGCPHCSQEQDYIHNDLVPEFSNLEIKEYEVYKNRQNGLFMQKAARELEANVSGVPFLIIGDKTFVGYLEGTTSKEIRERVEECSLSACPDSIAAIAQDYPEDAKQNNGSSNNSGSITDENTGESNASGDSAERIINLPLVGEVDAMKLSLPALTVLIGVLDGFNPCAMWVLLFLITLLLGMKDRRKMWILGIAFIVASALVYFVFMAAWLNLIIFLGFIVWVRILIGLIALAGGVYSIRDYFVNKDSGCKVVGADKKRKTFDRLKEVVHNNSLWLALGGIILLAFAINLVELICSAGLPAVYSQILILNDLPTWKNYSYILLYVFFFMLDDLIVFFIAMTTLKITGITTKYTRASRIIGGILMLAIGLMLIFKPEWLMFG